MQETGKMEGDYQAHRETTRISAGNKDFQPFDIHRWFICNFVETAPARRTVFNLKQSFHSVKITAQAAVCEWYGDTTQDWFYRAKRKLPKRWQLGVTWERNMLS
jgi:hypothetical protein